MQRDNVVMFIAWAILLPGTCPAQPASGPSQDPGVVARLQGVTTGLKSPHAAVVDAAAARLGPSLDPAAVPTLRELERDPVAGTWASLVLARWGQRVDRPASVLTPLLESDRPWVRTGAAHALTRSGPAELKGAIDALGHANVDVRVDVALALQARFDPVISAAVRPSRDEAALSRELQKAGGTPAAVRGLQRHGLKAGAVFAQLLDLLASERSNPINKPLADAAVVVLQDLYALAAETEGNASPTTSATTRPAK